MDVWMDGWMKGVVEFFYSSKMRINPKIKMMPKKN